MGIFKWIFLGPKPLKIISLGLDYFKNYFLKFFYPYYKIISAGFQN